MRSRDVAVPMKNGNAGFIAKLGDTEKLVIDEGFKRSYIKCAEGSGHIVIELREDGEEGGFCFTRRGLRGQKDVIGCAEDDLRRRDLHGREGLPSPRVDELPYERRVGIKNVHYSFKSAKFFP